MTATTLFISDLHLQPETPEIAQGFLDYMARLATCEPAVDRLYLLGDIFEVWVGDDYRDDFTQRMSEAMQRVSARGTRLYFMHGNRDFLIGETFAAEAGVTLLPDPSVIELDGERVLLMHGDSMCTRDEAYMKFRAMTRDPQWQAQILAMPLEQRLALAQSLRMQSGETNSEKDEAIMDVTPEEVVREMREHGVRTLIHGHTHRPAVHELEIDGEAARRIVLGDWRPDTAFDIIACGQGPTLREFALPLCDAITHD
ncbi:UDP-2,3-diacylglucosamine diphosphatase [Cobetia sp. MMG027]|uniref:UDP-2,3-diacylglucosamine diphosphatase n=1 Tax=Cobetia sp. MMG027 TaxID=3021980 RepID=UPI0022FE168F|nr:UDP-2,3-diacylglucosamine diphosphatase [Cobetia sp. MMG027]MDA5562669.1 UDP-2,3-diacylglucosamine diphosphatase [Cobetia sp. MMG027]